MPRQVDHEWIELYEGEFVVGKLAENEHLTMVGPQWIRIIEFDPGLGLVAVIGTDTKGQDDMRMEIAVSTLAEVLALIETNSKKDNS